MSDPNTPAPDAQQPTPPAQPPRPTYGEYAPTTPPTSAPATPPAAPAYGESAPAAPAYQQPAYSAAPAYDAPAGYGAAPGTPVPGKTLGIVAFVVSFFFNVIGLILGIVALVQSKKAGRGNGFAIAAIIIGSLSVILTIIVFFAFVVPTFSAATTCVNDPTAIVTVWGVDVPCSEVVNGSN